MVEQVQLQCNLLTDKETDDYPNSSWSVKLDHKFPEKIRPFQMPRLKQVIEVLPLGIRFVIKIKNTFNFNIFKQF